MNGEIKAWLYDNGGPRVSYDAPGLFCTRMAYTADGKRYSLRPIKDGLRIKKNSHNFPQL